MINKIKRICKTCKKTFGAFPYHVKRGWGIFCSRKCRKMNYKSKKIKFHCKICNKAFDIFPCEVKARKYCSKKCFCRSLKGRKRSKETKEKISLSRIGAKNCRWKGGRYKKLGYIYIKQPNHLFCDKRGYVYEHRFVMEKHIGRYLKPEEVVHHINDRRSDNRIENLKIFHNLKEHLSFHRMKKSEILCK